MTIETRQLLSSVVSAGLVVLIAALLLWANQETKEAVAKSKRAHQIVQGMSELKLLTIEYILYRGKHPLNQWQEKRSAIVRLLQEEEESHTLSKRFILKGIRTDLDNLKNLFFTLRLAHKDQANTSAEIELYQELEAGIISQILISSQSVISGAFQLGALSQRRVEKAQQQSVRMIFISLLILGVLFGANVILLRKYVLNPLIRLKQNMQIIGEGNLSFQVDIQSHDEMGEVARSFNEMTRKFNKASGSLKEELATRTRLQEEKEKAYSELARAQDATLNITEDLKGEVTERKKAEAEIIAKNKELETTLHVVSHDLKEPLRAIEGFADKVNEGYASRLDERGQDFLRRIVNAASRMDQLLNDFLALSRSRQIEQPTGEVPGEVIARGALERLKAPIEKSKARIEIARDLPRLRANKTWAVEGVYNLIGNALKFTHPGVAPEIEIIAYRPRDNEPQEIGLVVSDRGPGVAPEHRERIFGLFQRAVGHEVEGTGAGLAIVQSVAEQHGGHAWVRPREGGGSEFIITFGKAQP